MTRILRTTGLVGIAVGIGLVIQPVWLPGFRIGFFVTLAMTVLFIVASHMKEGEKVEQKATKGTELQDN